MPRGLAWQKLVLASLMSNTPILPKKVKNINLCFKLRNQVLGCVWNEICSIWGIPFFLLKSCNIWFDFKNILCPLLVRALKQHSLSQNFCFSRQIYTSIAYLLTAWSFKSWVLYILKVSKFQKQICLFFFPQKWTKLFFDFSPKDLKWFKSTNKGLY